MTSRPPIAVLGATGNQGGHVARALLEAGWPVRAITRHPESSQARILASSGAELVRADMRDVDTLVRAFDGAHGIFSVQNFWELGLRQEVRLGTNVIEAARAVGRPHVVYSSGLGAERIQGVVAIDGKAILEERLQQSGLAFTILRPGLFMDDFMGASLPFARPMQQLLKHHRPLVGRLFLSILRAVVPCKQSIPLTTLQDVGLVAAWAWEHVESSGNHIYPLVGSCPTTCDLRREWHQVTGQNIPAILGAKVALRVFHPTMAQLLHWLAYKPVAVSQVPFRLCTFSKWLRDNRSVAK